MALEKMIFNLQILSLYCLSEYHLQEYFAIEMLQFSPYQDLISYLLL